jgi:charged multivesicular body protein 7
LVVHIKTSVLSFQRQSEEILRVANKAAPNNSLLTMTEIVKLAYDKKISGDGLQLVLQNLSNQKLVTMESIDVGLGEAEPKNVLLKFAGPNLLQAQPITEFERSIFTLEQTEHRLIKVIDDIESSIGQQQLKIKEALRDGKKQMAKNHLKKRKNFELELEKRSNVLDNVQTMLHRINATQSDKEVIDAYRMGSNALKRAFAESGLSIDNVEDTIAEMRDVLDMHNDVQSAINEPLLPTSQVEDKELEDELMDLLKSEEPKSPKPETKLDPTKMSDVDFDAEIERRLRGLKFDVSSLDVAGHAQNTAGNVSSTT